MFSRNTTQSRERWHVQQFSPNNFQLEVASDVIYSMAEEHIGMDIPVKFDDYRSNRSTDIQVAHFVMDKRRQRRWPKDPKNGFV